MVFDECPPHAARARTTPRRLERTLRWARECRDRQRRTAGQPVFGIVQGATSRDLREECAQALVAMDFDGYAIGGVSVGEPEPEMMRAIECDRAVPAGAQGRATRWASARRAQMVELIARGVDMFDCVLPTRVARNGTAFTDGGTINLRNNAYEFEKGPVDPGCTCPCCREFSLAYVRHLIRAEEILGIRLVTLHNLHYYLNLGARIRAAIEDGSFR